MAKQKYKFERLTPIDNMDLDVYEEAIDYVFSNSDVKNVAISGAYSAGKSSVLASYKKKHDELRFLHISLAHFKSTDQESDAEVKESTLEGKILNQLIHQIPSEKIPQTNFRVKKTVSSKSIATSTIGAVLFLISILHLLFFSVWKNYIGVLPVSLIKSILKLLAAFKECHLIDSYEESTTKAGYYKVARPKATKALSKEPSTVT